MRNIEKMIQNADAICDCIPVVSTLTNAGELLWKTVHKVNRTANPVKADWKNDLKVHVINKSAMECVVGLIPLVGNLANAIVYLLFPGIRTDPMIYALENHSWDAVELYLINHPLDACTENRAQRILESAASFCKDRPDIFDRILASRKWEADSIARVLQSIQWLPDDFITKLFTRYEKCSFPDTKDQLLPVNHLLYALDHSLDLEKEEKSHKILDFLSVFPPEPFVDPIFIGSLLIKTFEKAVEQGKEDIANRILDRCSKYELKNFTSVLVRRVPIKATETQGKLTKDQIEKIGELCTPCTLQQVVDYGNALQWRPDSLVPTKELEKSFYQAHSKIIEKLLGQVQNIENSKDLIDPLVSLIETGAVFLFDTFLKRYENQLTSEEKLAILKKISWNVLDGRERLQSVNILFQRWQKEIADTQVIDWLNSFAERTTMYGEKVVDALLSLRPTLKENYSKQLKEVRDKCAETKTRLERKKHLH